MNQQIKKGRKNKRKTQIISNFLKKFIIYIKGRGGRGGGEVLKGGEEGMSNERGGVGGVSEENNFFFG